MTEAEFQALAAAGLQPNPGASPRRAPISTRRSRSTCKLAERPVFLPARVGGRRRALRALLVHRPRLRRAHRGARAHGAAPAARRARRRRLPGERRGATRSSTCAASSKRHRVAPLPAALRFGGGLAGYFGYDTVRHIERTRCGGEKPDPLGTPDMLLLRLRRARGGRQRARQALPRRLRRSRSSPTRCARRKRRLEELRARLREPLPEVPVPASANAPLEAAARVHLQRSAVPRGGARAARSTSSPAT